MKSSFFIISMILSLSINAQSILIVGTYDSPNSEGIYMYNFNNKTGETKLINNIKTSNPSYLTVSTNQKMLYAVNENANDNGNGGSVSAFEIKKKGQLKFLNEQNSEGNHPCYIVADNSNNWVIAGNYSTGNFSVMGINKNGSLKKVSQIIQHKGSGPDTSRQKSPHVHSTVFNKKNDKLYVADLGNDKIMCYSFDSEKGKMSTSKKAFIQLKKGSGPRHIVLSANEKYLYLTEELSGDIAVIDIENDKNKIIQIVSTLKNDFIGNAGSADIHISKDGNFLYSTNRAELNTINIFKINSNSGKLKLITSQSTMGLTPRNFNFDPSGKFLLIANQNSDEIVIFKVASNTGLLTESGFKISVGKPVCLKWLY